MPSSKPRDPAALRPPTGKLSDPSNATRRRRIQRAPVLLALMVGGLAAAATLTETDATRWNIAGRSATNLTIGNTLVITTRETVTDDWYRAPWDGLSFEEQGQKDDGTFFSESDRCLRDADNAGLAGDTATVNGHEHRTGPHVERISGTDYVATVPTVASVPLPAGTTVVNAVRFLTSGAHIAAQSYTVRFHYADVGTPSADVVVPIVVDTETTLRDGSTPDYDVVGISGLVHNPDTSDTWDADNLNGSDCGGDGADEVTVFNPNPGLDVTDIEFVYVDYVDAASATGWLSGPLAVTLLVDETDYDLTYLYQGNWGSATSTTNAPKATANAVWKRISWTATGLANGSEINVSFTCGNDSSGNGTLEPGELAATQVVGLQDQVSPYTLPATCVGRYVQYQLEFVERFGDNPTLSDISFTYDLDADSDGYDATFDCDDNSAAVHPGATEVPGNNVDEDCDNAAACYTDTDNDGARTNTVDPDGATVNEVCTDNFEGLASDPVDCDDNTAAVGPGAPEVPGNNVDEDCTNTVECYDDDDNDGEKLLTTFVTAAGDLDCTGLNEGQIADLVDCNDANPAINHAAIEIQGDEVDQDCNSGELCWPDVDQDGDRANSGSVVSANSTCQGANEGANSDPVDCNDNNNAIRSSATEGPGDNVDQNCDTREICYVDNDDDGDRSATQFTTSPGDTTCVGPNEGVASDAVDCNDNNLAINSNAAEVQGDEVDQDCDGDELCWPDVDRDGERANSGSVASTTNSTCQDAGEGATVDRIDCNDGNPLVLSTASEQAGDSVDQNCDTVELCYTDADNDGDRLGTTFSTLPGDTNCSGANEGLATDPIDCDDNNDQIKSTAVEIKGDEVDQNCDTDETCWPDSDNDGDRANTGSVASSDVDCDDNFEAPTSASIDCDDSDPLQNSGLPEVIGDGIDQDCDTHDRCYQDLDGDGHGSTLVVTSVGATCLTANNESTNDNDCDDTTGTRSPTNPETAGNNVDNNCDDRELCYTDADDDGARLGTTFTTTAGDTTCTGVREGEAGDPLDCDDAVAAIRPSASELAGDNVDQNCDTRELCYFDQDDDGARLETSFLTNAGDTTCNGAQEGRAADPVDCDDTNPNIKPGVSEIPGNNVDDNCTVSEDCYVDADDDGARTGGIVVSPNAVCTDPFEGQSSDPLDCVDNNAAIRPNATELAGDNVDQNCDQRELCYTDADDDGNRWTTTFTTGLLDTTCNGANEGLATDPQDCNDNVAAINTFATEGTGDNLDQNCDGQEDCWPDVDNDDDRAGSGEVLSLDTDCDDPNEGRTADRLDCDDNNADRASRNVETAPQYIANGVDNTCDGQEVCYVDDDDDDARTNAQVLSVNASCGEAGEDLVTALLDCDDTNPNTYPGAPEIPGNQVDNDCNGGGEVCYVDFDEDGYRLTTTVVSPDSTCATVDGEATAGAGIDCDDRRALTNPGANDTCGNGIDDDCDSDGGPSDDDDGDTLSWTDEQGLGTNDCDTDSDNDNLPDNIEFNVTGTDPALADSDGDGMRDDIEVGANPNSPRDTDSDTIIDALDDDDDDDGVLSVEEDVVSVDGNPRNDDSDLDGIANPLDDDDDGDGVDTLFEDADGDLVWDDDTDNDGLEDWLDNDDDGDGIRTINENLNSNATWFDDDTDNDQAPNFLDADDDGDTVLTLAENVNGVGDARDDNTDGTDAPNYLDTDDDNDTILTTFEYNDAPGRDVDTDGTQNHLDTDSDADGYNDATEGRFNTDGDSGPVVYDYLDLDSDNDTVTDRDEARTDTDTTGGVNRVDTDDDGDGIPTSRENNEPNVDDDVDNDGVSNWIDSDSDADGWSDLYEFAELNNGLDEDGDGFANYVDTDSDADRLPDDLELELVAVPADSDSDGIENRLDEDDDGDTVFTTIELGNNPNNPADQDTDGAPNYLDTDDDDDGEDTITEIPDGGLPESNDTDLDAQPNFLDDDDDDDGIPTLTELNMPGVGRDVDGDRTENHLDDDSDGDSFPDAEEGITNTDGQDRLDFVDLDSDNDNVVDADELHANSDLGSPNGDNLDDRRDPDDDGDQVPTAEECSDTCGDSDPMNDNWDNDALADYLDEDDDGDGVTTLDEDWDNSGNPRDDNSDRASLYGDVLPDHLDDDDDGDGIPTAEEEDAFIDGDPLNDDTDSDGKPNYRDEDDDNDGFRTWEEAASLGQDPRGYDFPDRDGRPNFLDFDDDDDRIDTICEYRYTVNHLDVDTDNDTVIDGDEWFRLGPIDPRNGTGTACDNAWDSDQDSTINALDPDDDNDGLGTGVVEPPVDLDCAPGTGVPQPDGLPAYVDTDSDNDGKPDGLDYGAPNFEEGPNGDEDGDGVPDYLDCDSSGAAGDSDSDGILNGDEQSLCALFGLSGASCSFELLLDPDFDNDMVLDGIELGFNPAQPLDSDLDGFYDLADEDDDEDGLLTSLETVDVDAGALPDPASCATEIGHFFDLGGLYWTFYCQDAGGAQVDFDFGDDAIDVYWNLDCDDNDGANPGCSFLVETPDADPNFRDDDDDGDGKTTADELALANEDLDGDGLVNWYDPWDGDGGDGDADGDGLVTSVEEDLGTDPYNDDTDHDGITDDVEVGDALTSDDAQDSDGDGRIDAVDEDDDNDNIPTSEEGSADVDGDDVPNHLDTDSDGDGVPDSQEGAGEADDVDCDGIVDAYDGDDADGSCELDDSGKNNLFYLRQGCGGCASGQGAPTPTILLFGAAALVFRRRRR